MVYKNLPSTNMRNTRRNRQRLYGIYKRANYRARRSQHQYGKWFRNMTQMPYVSRKYDGNRFTVRYWGPWRHQYLWSRTPTGRLVTQPRPPQVVDTSRVHRPIVGPPTPSTVGTLPRSWYQTPLTFEQSNRDWSIKTPFNWPWSRPEVIIEKPVPGTPYYTWKKGGFQYYRHRSTQRIDYIHPTWSLPFHTSFPGGKEWKEIPGRPPGWFNIVDKVGRMLLPPRQETERVIENSYRPCYHWRYNVQTKTLQKVPCSQKEIWARRKKQLHRNSLYSHRRKYNRHFQSAYWRRFSH